MNAQREQHTIKPFTEALGDLLRERSRGGPLGRISLRAFFATVEGFEYEYLRKMVMGERPLRPEAIEAMAKALGKSPEFFVEYRGWRIGEALKRHPSLVALVYDLVIAEAEALDQEMAEAAGDSPDLIGRDN